MSQQNKPTRAMHLTYDMRIGGTEMVIKNIIEGSASESLIHSIYCIEEPLGPWGQELQQNGVQITSCNRQPGFDTNLIGAIRKHIKQHEIDVLHCHQYTPWVYGCIAAMFTKTKVIFTEHGRFYPDFGTWKRKLVNPILCKFTKHITAISKATKEALIEHENIPRDRIEVIYNGIKPVEVNEEEVTVLRKKLAISPDTKVLGTIARLDPIKNHKMMLDAFAMVLKEHPDTVLIIVGDGEERQNIENQIAQLGIQDKVIMPGYDPKPAKYLALMDIFLLSSLSEGTSMTLLEAMSLGKPCVVTDVGGNPEVIKQGFNGEVSPSNVHTEFRNRIQYLLSFERYLIFSRNAYVDFDNRFFSAKMCSNYKQKYDD
ncbi:glycosyltransferase [Catenovulum agarivorans]|uniref:glycosyltransferase n=1 Tax=Catenovulum agarivorans TaxID=1172192 RepID=UPI00031D9632|nr:glycosyltransferase [Catenovulum agarivorans]